MSSNSNNNSGTKESLERFFSSSFLFLESFAIADLIIFNLYNTVLRTFRKSTVSLTSCTLKIFAP
ncbi:hypothetical protein R80B4_02307 [Fibrobacteres bacterium R8-0-B4]